MGEVLGFFGQLWNFAWSIAPTVLRVACEITSKGADVVKIGTGS